MITAGNRTPDPSITATRSDTFINQKGHLPVYNRICVLTLVIFTSIELIITIPGQGEKSIAVGPSLVVCTDTHPAYNSNCNHYTRTSKSDTS